jgi:hypothetical protein
MGTIELPNEKHPTVLVFIENEDQAMWVPSAGRFGVAPLGEDGLFRLSGIIQEPKSVSLGELEKIIKE